MKKYILPILIVLVASLFFVYFGRIYFPETFHPQTVSFLESYSVVIAVLIVTIFLLVMLFLVIVLYIIVYTKAVTGVSEFFNKFTNIFLSRTKEKKRLKKELERIEEQKRKATERKQQSESDWLTEQVKSKKFDWDEWNKFRNQPLKYKTKFRKEITDHILLETFEVEIEYFKAAHCDDTYSADSKEKIISQLVEGRDCFVSLGVYFCILKGITIEKKKDEIIKEIEQLEDFKWIRLSYIRTELTAYEIQKFEQYKREGFPNYGFPNY